MILIEMKSFFFWLVLAILFQTENATENDEIRSQLIEAVDANNIAEYLRTITLKPHPAGTIEDEVETANFVKDNWIKQGLDDVQLINYTVLLSYPNSDRPNKVRIIAKNESVVFESSGYESPLQTDEERRYYKSLPPFLAFSPATTSPVVGDLVYVNYGRVEDYDQLDKLNVSLAGRIALIRYGYIFRGNKVKQAADRGAVGAILYDDPADFTSGDLDYSYPKSIFLPKSGVQRGSILLRDGDPMTPGYPSTKSAYRLPKNQWDLPKIPAHCINYEDARILLEHMTGPAAPKDWTGGLNVTYRLGPSRSDGSRISLEVTTNLTQRTIRDVVGVIRGSEEPDRLVMVGNHRDAWTFGAVDPSSGTASMLDMSNVITKVMKANNWRPRRSIVFCSWAAEEYGLMGSTEFVEQNLKMLQSQAVVYLNVDISVEANVSLNARGTPMTYSPAWQAAKRVPNPDPEEVKKGRKTLYDTWFSQFPQNNTGSGGRPKINAAGSGSDHTKFMQFAGVSVFDFWYGCGSDPNKCKWYIDYPLYHTLYETFFLMNDLYDRGFKFSKAITQFWTEMVRSYADSTILPMSPEFYPNDISLGLEQLKQSSYFPKLEAHNITLNFLTESATNFKSAVDAFLERIKRVDPNNTLTVRAINDQLLQLERCFIDEAGLPHRSDYRHVVSGPNPFNSYGGGHFPGLYGLLWEAEHGKDNHKQWETIRQHLAAIAFHIDAATALVSQRLW